MFFSLIDKINSISSPAKSEPQITSEPPITLITLITLITSEPQITRITRITLLNQGDKNAPAVLENVRVKGRSKLSGVKLGKGVKLDKGVLMES
jgi:hypothetical protein